MLSSLLSGLVFPAGLSVKMLHVDETGSFAMSVYLVKWLGFNVDCFLLASSCHRKYAPAAAAVAVTTTRRSQRRLFADDAEEDAEVVVDACRFARGDTGRIDLLQAGQKGLITLNEASDDDDRVFILYFGA